MDDNFEDDFEDGETIFCPKDDCEIDPEKCFDCDYLADEDEYHCRYGEVPVEYIQAEQIREQEYEIAVDKIWRET